MENVTTTTIIQGTISSIVTDALSLGVTTVFGMLDAMVIIWILAGYDKLFDKTRLPMNGLFIVLFAAAYNFTFPLLPRQETFTHLLVAFTVGFTAWAIRVFKRHLE